MLCDRSPSRIRNVRRISLGTTILPRSSILRTIPVAFTLKILLCCIFFANLLSATGFLLCIPFPFLLAFRFISSILSLLPRRKNHFLPYCLTIFFYVVIMHLLSLFEMRRRNYVYSRVLQRVGGWCKPMEAKYTVSFRSRVPDFCKELRLPRYHG